MTLPFHRGQTNMTYRGSNWGGKDKVDEANRSLMEQEIDRKWVSKHHFSIPKFVLQLKYNNVYILS